MNREYKFRGKKINGKEWVFGFHSSGEQGGKTKHFIAKSHWDINYEVIPQTIGFGSDFYDDNDQEVFEDDIVQVPYGKGKIVFKGSAFMIEWLDDPEANMEYLSHTPKGRARDSLIVIGNIHDTHI